MQLNYKYRMDLEFSMPVTDQHFSIMCLPRDTERQKCIENNVRVSAVISEQNAEINIRHNTGTDGLGNQFVHGLIREPHSAFRLVSEGIVETGGSLFEEYEDPASIRLWLFRTDSPYTVPGNALKELWSEWQKEAPADEYGTMLHYGNCVQAALRYVSGSTDVATTAEQAVLLGKGVCQDYAHVMIALLRMSGIPARYAVGMIPGEGETHAWVEANCRGYWYGIDPTNNVLVNDQYIKFSHGRDYGDCMISRGIFTNPYAVQTTKAAVSVQEVQQ